MTLPKEIINYLEENAIKEGTQLPEVNENLFAKGILDSFGLVDFVSLIEATCKISIPDEDITAENFQTIAKTEQYINSHSEKN